MNTHITGHMIVKNEDRWVWFAIQSALPYVDQLLIIDTGSTDKTIDCIKSIKSSKISLLQTTISSQEDMTALRNKQLAETKTNWIWIIDGDEIYTPQGAKEITQAVSQDLKGIVVRRYDLLGDIYHRQVESIGEYHLLNNRGHLLVRLINVDYFPGLHVARPYPLEAYLDNQNRVIHNYDQHKWFITQHHLYHAMYLTRSSLGNNLAMFNRSKYKVETGLKIEDSIPEVFSLERPNFVQSPIIQRGFGYELAASIITPIKDLKRKFI